MSNLFQFGTVLKLKGLTADPASGEGGSLYYNTTDGKVRAYQNGSWGDAGITLHDALQSIDGGQAGEYYHLTAAEYTGTGSGSFVRASSPTINTPKVEGDLDITSSGADSITIDGVNKEIILHKAGGFTTKLKAQSSSSNVLFNLPVDNGSSDQFLKTDGTGNLAWSTVATSIIGKALDSGNILVGNGSNLSAQVDASSLGEISASTASGLEIKSGVVTDAKIATNAAIARSKIASGLLNRLVYNDAAGSLADLAAITANRALISDATGLPVHSTVTATELGYLSGVTSAIQTQISDKLSLTGGSMSGDIAMNGSKIIGLGMPSGSSDAATKGYVDAQRADMDFQPDVNSVIADASQPAPASPVAGDRYILESNTSTIDVSWGTIAGIGDNDIVEYNGTAWTLTYDVSAKGAGAMAWSTLDGYFLRWNGVSWDEFGGLSGITAGVGLDKVGNELRVLLGAGIKELPTDEVGLDLFSTGGLMLTVDGTLSSTSSNAQLAVKKDDITIGINASGLYIKDGGISNTHIASDAAIALSKLSALSVSRALTSDASGVITTSSVTTAELGYLSGVTSAIQTQFTGKADRDLSNLTATAINQSLLPDTTELRALGSASLAWSSAYVADVVISTNAITVQNNNVLQIAASSFETNAGQVLITANGSGSLISAVADTVKFNNTVEVANNAVKILNPANATASTVLSAQHYAVPNGQSAWLDVFSSTTANSIKIDYSVIEANTGASRTGTIFMAKNVVDNSVAMTDFYAETAVIGNGISFNSVGAASLLKLQISGTSTNIAALRFTVTIVA